MRRLGYRATTRREYGAPDELGPGRTEKGIGAGFIPDAVASLGQTEGMFYEQLLELIGAAFRVVSLSEDLRSARIRPSTPPSA